MGMRTRTIPERYESTKVMEVKSTNGTVSPAGTQASVSMPYSTGQQGNAGTKQSMPGRQLHTFNDSVPTTS
jgi:hypothetical protein